MRYGPESSAHLKVDADSEDLNLNVGLRLCVFPEGPDVIVVCGACESTLKLRAAGVGSTLPEGSIARTRNVWGPWPKPL